MNFLKIASGVDVMPLLLDVQRQPELWNKNPCRLSERGPHYETQDMFLRYKDETENIKTGNWKNFSDPHFAEWNKTIDYLPHAKAMTFELMSRVRAEILGGVFLYKLQPGKKIHQHVDKGWHPEFYDKFNICLQSNPNAAFCYEGEAMVQQAGDIHHFRNDVLHWVVNEGQEDHIVMTVCVRLDRGYRVPWSPEGWELDKSLGRKTTCQQPG